MNNTKVLEFLLQHGADPNIYITDYSRYQKDERIVHITTLCYLFNISPFDSDTDDVLKRMELLLSHGANPNTLSYGYAGYYQGYGPHHLMSKIPFTQNNFELIKLLLRYGANPHLEIKDKSIYYWSYRRHFDSQRYQDAENAARLHLEFNEIWSFINTHYSPEKQYQRKKLAALGAALTSTMPYEGAFIFDAYGPFVFEQLCVELDS